MKKKAKKVYISGPISGLERNDYMGRFRVAELALRYYGYRTCNPTRFLVCRWPWLYRIIGYRLTLLYDIYQLMRCDRYFVMPGYSASRGCRIEQEVANNFRIPEVDESISVAAAVMLYMYKNE